MQLIGKGKKSTTVSSILNIIGLTAAFAALYIILVQVWHDLSFNKSIRDHERVYALAVPDDLQAGFSPSLCRPVGEAIVAGTPGIESGCATGGIGFRGQLFVETGESEQNSRMPDLDRAIPVGYSSFSEGVCPTLGIDLIAGSWENMIGGQHYAISESLAQRTGLQVGDTFALRDLSNRGVAAAFRRTVAAIYRDLPKNSFLGTFDLFSNLGEEAIDDAEEWSYTYFVKLAPQASAEAVAEAAEQLILHLSGDADDDDASRFELRLYNLHDAYFDRSFFSSLPQGNKTTSLTLLAVAVLVVLIAFINYVNFFFAQVPIRLRGINTRKIFGCSRSRLVASLVGESVTMVAGALLLGALVVCAFEHSSGAQLISTSIAFGQNIPILLFTVAVALAIAVAASLYPALYLTSFAPAFALKGSMGSVRKGNAFRTTLIGLQFAVSMVLIICAIFVDRQHRFMLDRDMGFDQEQLLTVQVTYTQAGSLRETIESTLCNDPAIREVAWGDGPIVAAGRMTWGRYHNGRHISYECYPVSWNFLQFMGIERVDGRDFVRADELAESGAFIFNETGAQLFELKAGDWLMGHNGPAEVVGICRDFNHSPLSQTIKPFAFYVWGKEMWRPCMQLFIRTEANIDLPALIRRVKEALHEAQPTIPADYFEVRLFDETLHNHYLREERLATLVILFTLLAIIISLMGVFGLVMFETEYRRKEIGIRRVNGATVGEILALFNGRFVRILLVCFLVSVPAAWWIVDRYLENYAYRIPIAAWVFCVALLAVLAVTIGVVTLRSWRAATANPVESVKNE